MASTHQVAGYKWLKPLRIIRVRWRLFFAAVVGLIAFAMMPDDLDLISRVLIGWDIGVALYLALAIWAAIGTDTKHIRLRSVLFDEGRVAIPLLSVTAALASLGAIFFQLSTAPAGRHFTNLIFAVVTILLSWSFIQFIFAFHYAHEFYADHRGKAGGLAFPNDEAPVLLGLPLFLIRDRNDVAGVGCLRDIQIAEEDRSSSQLALVHLQCHPARAGHQFDRNRHRQSLRLLALGPSPRRRSQKLRSELHW